MKLDFWTVVRNFFVSIFFGTAKSFEKSTYRVDTAKTKWVYQDSYCEFKPRHYFAKFVGLSSFSLVGISLLFALVVNLNIIKLSQANSSSFVEDFSTNNYKYDWLTTANWDTTNQRVVLKNAWSGMGMQTKFDTVSTQAYSGNDAFIYKTGADGTKYVMWNGTETNKQGVFLAKWNGISWSSMDGLSPRDQISDPLVDSSGQKMIIGNDNLPYVVWLESDNGNIALKFTKWTGSGWSKMDGNQGVDILDASAGDVIGTPDMVLDQNNNPNIVWNSSMVLSNINFVRWSNDAWRDMSGNLGQEVVVGLSNSPQILLGSSSEPVVLSYKGNNLYLKHWNGSGWTGMDGVSVEDVLSLQQCSRAIMKVDSKGWPNIVWNETLGLKYARWDGSAWVGMAGGSIDTFTNYQWLITSDFKLDISDKPFITINGSNPGGPGGITSYLAFTRWNGTAWSGLATTSELEQLDTSFYGSLMARLQLGSDGSPYLLWGNGNNGYFTFWNNGVWSKADGTPGLEDLGTGRLDSQRLIVDSNDVPSFIFGDGTSLKFSHYDRSRFFQPAVVQSNNVNLPENDQITSATLSVVDDKSASTSITYYLTNNGSDWATTSPGQKATFSTTGGYLAWKAVLATEDASLSPAITRVQIDYTYNAEPAVPELLLPLDLATTTTDMVDLSARYFDPDSENELNIGKVNFQVATDDQFTKIIFASSSIDNLSPSAEATVKTQRLEQGATFYWRAQNEDLLGKKSIWSVSRSFVVGQTHGFVENFVDTNSRSSESTALWSNGVAKTSSGWHGLASTTAKFDKLGGQCEAPYIVDQKTEIDSEGNPHVIFESCGGIYYSRWSGAAWVKADGTAGNEIINPMGSPLDKYKILIDSGNRPHIFWQTQNDLGNGSFSIHYTHWNGVEWAKGDDSAGSEIVAPSFSFLADFFEVSMYEDVPQVLFINSPESWAAATLYYTRLMNGAWVDARGLPGQTAIVSEVDLTFFQHYGLRLFNRSSGFPVIFFLEYTYGYTNLYQIEWTSGSWPELDGLSEPLSLTNNSANMQTSFYDVRMTNNKFDIAFVKQEDNNLENVYYGRQTAQGLNLVGLSGQVGGDNLTNKNVGDASIYPIVKIDVKNGEPAVAWINNNFGKGLYFSQAVNGDWSNIAGKPGIEKIAMPNLSDDNDYNSIDFHYDYLSVPEMVFSSQSGVYFLSSGSGIWKGEVDYSQADELFVDSDLFNVMTTFESSLIDSGSSLLQIGASSTKIATWVSHDNYSHYLFAAKYVPGGATAISTTVATSSINISQATLNYLGLASTTFFLSNNGGASWSTTTPGVELVFPTTGSDLRWKAEIGNGQLEAVYLDWVEASTPVVPPGTTSGGFLPPPVVTTSSTLPVVSPVATTVPAVSPSTTTPLVVLPPVTPRPPIRPPHDDDKKEETESGHNDRPAGGRPDLKPTATGQTPKEIKSTSSNSVSIASTSNTSINASSTGTTASQVLATVTPMVVREVRISTDGEVKKTPIENRVDKVFTDIEMKIEEWRRSETIQKATLEVVEPIGRVLTGAIAVAEVGVIAATGVGSQALVIANQLVAHVGQLTNFSGLLSVLGIRRRRRWGVVHDLHTKKPLAGVSVLLYQKTFDKLLDKQMTDALGRFSFVATPDSTLAKALNKAEEVYYLKIEKPGYVINTSMTEASGVYCGQTISAAEFNNGQANFDVYLELAQVSRFEPISASKIMAIQVLRATENVLHILSPYVFIFGALLGIIAGLIRPSIMNNGVLVVYLILGLAHLTVRTFTVKSFGVIYDEAGKKPVSRAVVRLFDFGSKRLISTQATSDQGKYQFLLLKGHYFITVSSGGYEEYTSKLINVEQSDVADFDVRLSKL